MNKILSYRNFIFFLIIFYTFNFCNNPDDNNKPKKKIEEENPIILNLEDQAKITEKEAQKLEIERKKKQQELSKLEKDKRKKEKEALILEKEKKRKEQEALKLEKEKKLKEQEAKKIEEQEKEKQNKLKGINDKIKKEKEKQKRKLEEEKRNIEILSQQTKNSSFFNKIDLDKFKLDNLSLIKMLKPGLDKILDINPELNAKKLFNPIYNQYLEIINKIKFKKFNKSNFTKCYELYNVILSQNEASLQLMQSVEHYKKARLSPQDEDVAIYNCVVDFFKSFRSKTEKIYTLMYLLTIKGKMKQSQLKVKRLFKKINLKKKVKTKKNDKNKDEKEKEIKFEINVNDLKGIKDRLYQLRDLLKRNKDVLLNKKNDKDLAKINLITKQCTLKASIEFKVAKFIIYGIYKLKAYKDLRESFAKEYLKIQKINSEIDKLIKE